MGIITYQCDICFTHSAQESNFLTLFIWIVVNDCSFDHFCLSLVLCNRFPSCNKNSFVCEMLGAWQGCVCATDIAWETKLGRFFPQCSETDLGIIALIK